MIGHAIDHLRAIATFIAIADTGSLTRAAKTMSVSPPSVTRIISQLEESLGLKLLHRTTRIVTLTEVGRAYLEDVRKIFEDLRDAEDAAKGAYREPQGLLRLTAPTLFGQHYISPIIMDYLEQYTDVAVEAVFLDRVVNILEEGFDIAVRIGALQDSNLMSTRVGRVRRVVCGSPSYFENCGLPKSPEDLAGHKIVDARPASPNCNWLFADGTKQKIRPRFFCTSLSAAIEAAKSGWGLTRVLSYQIGPELAAGNLQIALSEFEPEPLPIHLLHAEGRQSSAKVGAFVALATKLLRADTQLG